MDPNNEKPVAFRRISDGDVFTLCDDGVTYSNLKLKMDFPGHLILKHHRETFSEEDFDTIFLKDL